MATLPSGTVTFLFTDIDGSTRLWEHDRAAMQSAVVRHLDALRAVVTAHGGVLFKIVGDGTQSAFPTAGAALAAALSAQLTFQTESSPDLPSPLRVRMALHAGEAAPDERADYLAAPLNRAARLLAAGHGGQIVMTQTVQQLARDTLPVGSTLRDLGDHRLRDLREPERVYQLLHPDLPAAFPPLRTMETRPNNLPPQATSFVGRDRQVTELVGFFQNDGSRVLTITGPGGVGKTRLALQVANTLLDEFPDGVWFVDLSTADAGNVLPLIAAIVGVQEQHGDLAGQVSALLAEKTVLLVLDNCERVAATVADVVSALGHIPGLRVLATSRTPLHVYGEQEFLLVPMAAPDPELSSEQELQQSEAIQLFVNRARAVIPDFAITKTNVRVVAEICSRLDGLPLAVELAAARVKMLPPQALRQRLERRLPLLTGGARTLPARQQTMRDAIAWSVDLLTPEEQTVFRRLAVFPAGCTLDAAEAVAGGDGAGELFSCLTALVDQSLLRQEPASDDEPRFRMLETVREFGLEALAASGDEDMTRQRLADWYLELARSAAPDFDAGQRVSAWLQRLDSEVPNLLAAANWLATTGDAPGLLRLIGDTDELWIERPWYGDVTRWLDQGLAGGDAVPAIVRSRALHVLTFVTGLRGDRNAAIAHGESGLALASAMDDPFALGRAHVALAVALDFAGDPERAGPHYAAAAPLLRDAGMLAWAAMSLANVGEMRLLAGDLAGAVPILDEAIEQLRTFSYPIGLGVALGQRAYAARLQGDLERATALFAESIAAVAEMDGKRVMLGAVAGLAGVSLARDHPARAARLLGAVERAKETTGFARIAHTTHAARITEATRQALGDAAFAEAAAAGRQLTLKEAIAEALELNGSV